MEWLGSKGITIIALLVFAAATLAACSHNVTWSTGGQPRTVDVHVVDASNHPLPAVKVWVENYSGGNPGVTDRNGSCRVQTSEDEVTRVEVNGRTVVNRTLDASHGLQLRVVLSQEAQSE